MSYKALARKWRPGKFGEMIGQTHVLQALINALDNDRLHHAYLFTGTRGVGKTTVARIFAKSLNCESGVSAEPCGVCSACVEIDEGRFIDLIEVDAASRTKVEDTRELLENVQYTPTRGRYKVYLIDEVHMLSSHSFNALLKTLEEPPPHVKFLLATTDPQKLLPTVLSRCLQFNLKRLSRTQISDYLADVLGKESIKFEMPALHLIAGAADGSMRDALSLLDQGIAFGGGTVEEVSIRSMLGSIQQHKVVAVLDALANNDATGLMDCVEDVAQHLGDFEKLLAELLTLLQQIAIVQVAPDSISDDLEDTQAIIELASKISPEDIQLYYQIALIGRRDFPLSPEPRGGLEMTLLRMLAFRPTGKVTAETVRTLPAKVKSVTKASPVENSPSRPAVKSDSSPTKEPAVKRAAIGMDDDWDLLVDKLQLKGVLKELAMNCACQSREEGHWILSLEQANHQLFSAERQQRLRKLLCDALGSEIKLTINISGEMVESPAAVDRREKNSRQAEAVAEIESDPNIQAIKDVFDATVHQDSIRPID